MSGGRRAADPVERGDSRGPLRGELRVVLAAVAWHGLMTRDGVGGLGSSAVGYDDAELARYAFRKADAFLVVCDELQVFL